VRGQLTHGRFFEFPSFHDAPLRGEEAYEVLDDTLRRAVARHLVSDVPVGVFLSGGIDSPLVAAEACRQAPGIKGFTIGVAGSETDESDDARRYAQEMQIEHIVRTVTQDDALGLLDDVVEACSEPSSDFSIFPTLLVSRLARDHVTVALSGDGGDELFWGYPGRFAVTLEQAPYFALPTAVRYGAIAGRRFLGRGKATRETLWPDIGRLYQKKHTLLAEKDLRACIPDLPALPSDLNLFDYHGVEPDATAQWLRWNEFRLHLAGILQKVDRASMHHSLEVRVPLLDREVIDVALRTDWQSCLDVERRYGKIPLRRALGRRLRYQTTAKKGFTVPMHAWLTGPLRALLHDNVLNRTELLGVTLDRPHLQRINSELERGDHTKARGLWLLLSLALWQERHLRRRAMVPSEVQLSAISSGH
jgi:asparagine synthase (glutamine-hydrolysing)